MPADPAPQGILCARPEDFLWWEWGDEGVVALFDQGTGETHLLDIASAEVLRTLCVEPSPPPLLGERLIAAGVMESGDAGSDWLTQILDGLMRLELVAGTGAPGALGACG